MSLYRHLCMDVNEAHLAWSGQALTDRSFRAKNKIAAGRRAHWHRLPNCWANRKLHELPPLGCCLKWRNISITLRSPDRVGKNGVGEASREICVSPPYAGSWMEHLPTHL